MTVTIDGYPSHLKIGDEIKVSLRTKLPADAKRFAQEAQSEFDRIWLSFETRPVSLTLKQIVALSGEMYHVIRCALEDDPGEAGQWLSRRQERQADSVIASKSPRAALMIDPAGTLHSRLSSWVDGALAQRHLTVTQDTYQRLLVEFDRAAGDVAALLHKRASGDFSADTTAERFPSFEMAVSSPSVAPSYTGVTITKLLDGWSSRLKAPRPQTISRYRGIISQLVAYLGHDDAERLSDADIVRWHGDLTASGAVTHDTFIKAYRAAISTVYAYGMTAQGGNLSNPIRLLVYCWKVQQKSKAVPRASISKKPKLSSAAP